VGLTPQQDSALSVPVAGGFLAARTVSGAQFLLAKLYPLWLDVALIVIVVAVYRHRELALA